MFYLSVLQGLNINYYVFIHAKHISSHFDPKWRPLQYGRYEYNEYISIINKCKENFIAYIRLMRSKHQI